MKKIMFNNPLGLTDSVLKRHKTKTRRFIPQSELDRANEFQKYYFDATFDSLSGVELLNQFFLEEKIGKLPYKVGEVVAIAQSYKDAGVHSIPEEDDEFGCYDFPAEQTNGWTNKMFVRADLMPHRIRFTDLHIERLQDISDEDCIKEGVVKVVHKIPTDATQYVTYYYPCQYLKDCADKLGWGVTYDTPQKAFAVLIDKVSGKGTWQKNPFVFAYEFELIEGNKK